MKIINVPLTSLIPSQGSFERNSLDSLWNRLIREPILVLPHPHDPGKYLIYNGHNRCYERNRQGHATIQARVLETLDEIIRWEGDLGYQFYDPAVGIVDQTFEEEVKRVLDSYNRNLLPQGIYNVTDITKIVDTDYKFS
jgi:hypothetical protein